MKRSEVSAIASRSANAAFHAAGGPRAFTWLQALSPSEGGAAELGEYVAAYAGVTARDVYRRAVSGQGAASWDAAPDSLRVACEVFVAVVRGLEPRVRRDIVRAAVAAVSDNVVPLKTRELGAT